MLVDVAFESYGHSIVLTVDVEYCATPEKCDELPYRVFHVYHEGVDIMKDLTQTELDFVYFMVEEN